MARSSRLALRAGQARQKQGYMQSEDIVCRSADHYVVEQVKSQHALRMNKGVSNKRVSVP